MPEVRPTATLRALHDGSVDFILVGGLAAVLNGAPVNTFDVDAVHSREPANIDRLRHGPLDLLGTIGRDFGYPELLPRSIKLDVADGLRIRVLDLETLIAIKEELSGDKDRAVLPILRRTLEEKRRLEPPFYNKGT